MILSIGIGVGFKLGTVKSTGFVGDQFSVKSMDLVVWLWHGVARGIAAIWLEGLLYIHRDVQIARVLAGGDRKICGLHFTMLTCSYVAYGICSCFFDLSYFGPCFLCRVPQGQLTTMSC